MRGRAECPVSLGLPTCLSTLPWILIFTFVRALRCTPAELARQNPACARANSFPCSSWDRSNRAFLMLRGWLGLICCCFSSSCCCCCSCSRCLARCHSSWSNWAFLLQQTQLQLAVSTMTLRSCPYFNCRCARDSVFRHYGGRDGGGGVSHACGCVAVFPHSYPLWFAPTLL